MENSKNDLKEQEEKDGSIPENEKIEADNDQLGENSELTPVGEELEKEKEEGEGDGEYENPEKDGKTEEHPSPDDDPQLDVETVAP